ncbi:MAG: OmpA family protein [Bryobacteraceae bacterium]
MRRAPVLIFSVAASLCAQQPKAYPDGRGGEVRLPLGDLSFADEVVSFRPGSPSASAANSIPDEAIGPPDYKASVDDNYLTLGCGGELVVRFADNTLGDVAGPDIFIFEIGPAVESTELAVSNDAQTWIPVGRIAGAVASIDIESYVKPGDTFRYLRMTDGKSVCSGEWPGADIDAVAAIGAGRRITLDASVLFAVDRSDLAPAAEAVLNDLAAQLRGLRNVRIVLEGHTDSTGSAPHNLDLSLARAAAVSRFLTANAGISADALQTAGFGETQPIAPNDTDANRAKNRRVEVLILAR